MMRFINVIKTCSLLLVLVSGSYALADKNIKCVKALKVKSDEFIPQLLEKLSEPRQYYLATKAIDYVGGFKILAKDKTFNVDDFFKGVNDDWSVTEMIDYAVKELEKSKNPEKEIKKLRGYLKGEAIDLLEGASSSWLIIKSP